MRRTCFSLFLVLILFLTFPASVHASLVTIDMEGKLIWKVLASVDEVTSSVPRKEELRIKNLAASPEPPYEALVSLSRDNNKVSMNIKTPENNSNTDVTDYKDEIVEIETRNEADKIKIGNKNDKFTITQNGVEATTSLPISIDTKSRSIAVTTSGGSQNLGVMPADAVSVPLKANVVSEIVNLELTEGENGNLEYKILGNRTLNMLNLYTFPVEINTYMSAKNGDVVKTDETFGVKVLSFIFRQ